MRIDDLQPVKPLEVNLRSLKLLRGHKEIIQALFQSHSASKLIGSNDTDGSSFVRGKSTQTSLFPSIFFMRFLTDLCSRERVGCTSSWGCSGGENSNSRSVIPGNL